jgi:ribonuclease HI
MEKAVIHTDGASRGNPGPAAIGVVIKDGSAGPVVTISRRIGRATNNQAEYQAVIAALEAALEHSARQVLLYSDSELIVKQLKGHYRVKNQDLKPLYQRVGRLIARLDSFHVRHVPRNRNREADRLANAALQAPVDLGCPLP